METTCVLCGHPAVTHVEVASGLDVGMCADHAARRQRATRRRSRRQRLAKVLSVLPGAHR